MGSLPALARLRNCGRITCRFSAFGWLVAELAKPQKLSVWGSAKALPPATQSGKLFFGNSLRLLSRKGVQAAHGTRYDQPMNNPG